MFRWQQTAARSHSDSAQGYPGTRTGIQIQTPHRVHGRVVRKRRRTHISRGDHDVDTFRIQRKTMIVELIADDALEIRRRKLRPARNESKASPPKVAAPLGI